VAQVTTLRIVCFALSARTMNSRQIGNQTVRAQATAVETYKT